MEEIVSENYSDDLSIKDASKFLGMEESKLEKFINGEYYPPLICHVVIAEAAVQQEIQTGYYYGKQRFYCYIFEHIAKEIFNSGEIDASYIDLMDESRPGVWGDLQSSDLCVLQREFVAGWGYQFKNHQKFDTKDVYEEEEIITINRNCLIIRKKDLMVFNDYIQSFQSGPIWTLGEFELINYGEDSKRLDDNLMQPFSIDVLDSVEIKTAAQVINCTVDFLLKDAVNNQYLYMALEPYDALLVATTESASPKANYFNHTDDSRLVAMLPRQIKTMLLHQNVEITHLPVESDSPLPEYNWRLKEPQMITIENVYVPCSKVNLLKLQIERQSGKKINTSSEKYLIREIEIESDTSQGDTRELIPGSLPNTLMGKLAIKAAWQIECKKGKHASAFEVFSRLKKWINEELECDVLIKLENNEIIWRKMNGELNRYSYSTCQKALQRWHKTRKSNIL